MCSVKTDKVMSHDYRKTRLIYLMLIAVAGIAVYATSINNSFIWDDKALVTENIHIRDAGHIPRIFTEDIAAGAGKKSPSYRPVQILSYLFDYSLWKMDPKGYHLTNMILHILVALAVYLLVYLLFTDARIALLTALLFIVHPIHTEAVTYISGRADSLAGLFLLLAMISYIRYSEHKGAGLFCLTMVSFIIALFSRENSIIFPLMILLYHYAFKKRLDSRAFFAAIAIVLLYLLLRLTALKEILYHPQSTTTVFQRIPGFLTAVVSYIRLLLIPVGLHMEYGDNLFGYSDPKVLLGAGLALSLLIYAFRIRRSDRLGFFAVSWFFLLLLPSSNIYPIRAYMAEHWLYLPSIGFFLMVSGYLIRLSERGRFKPAAIIITAALLLFYSFMTIRQNSLWRDPITFYETTLKYVPASARVYYNLANEYSDAGRLQEAVEHYKKSIELEPEFFDSYNNLGNAYSAMARYSDAVESYKKAVGVEPDFVDAYSNIGLAYQIMGRYQESIRFYNKAIELDPDYAIAYNGLGVVYSLLGRNEEALKLYMKSIEKDPTYSNAYNNLGTISFMLGMKEEGITAYKKAIEVNPKSAEAYYGLGDAYNEMGKKEEAISYYNKAIEINPSYAMAYYKLGNAYASIGRYDEAEASYRKSLELSPGNPYVLEKLKGRSLGGHP